MNSHPVKGLHHVTAIASDPQANFHFYTQTLGLRLVKKTVNFDDPTAYHLYFGDGTGSPGSLITFFYWADAARGTVGAGQATALSFSVAPDALNFWQERLNRLGVPVTRHHRFGEETLSLQDPDGIPVEIVAVAVDNRIGWATSEISAELALRGMHTTEFTVRDGASIEKLLTHTLDYTLVRREGDRARFEASPGGSGRYADIVVSPKGPRGIGGAGTIHHVAFRVPTDADELSILKRIEATGLRASPVMDRNYFHSVYFREANGILFEIATDTPGFAIDEPASSLGSHLKLPDRFEPYRTEIENALPPLGATTTSNST
ncbi:MAG: ring-cleaving dioxygenase [Opitutaceae bacterium]|nr:ring-cleaving dioxygenase [Opitutaceae bacterium]